MSLVKSWTLDEGLALYNSPFLDLLYRAHTVHKENFPEGKMQLSTLLNIKDGGCPEDCHYCPQAMRYHTGVVPKKLMAVEEVRAQAIAAKNAGATRFCMGAAWRELKDRDVPAIVKLIAEIKTLGMECCVTLGMLTDEQAVALKAAGLDFYNHNIDTSAEYYESIITTHSQDDRLETIARVKNAGIKTCCGGIVGLGEKPEDRVAMLVTIANLDPPTESLPINKLMPVPGTPLQDAKEVDVFEFVRTIATARIMVPKARVRLSAGRTLMSDEMQALCFFAGANSIFYGGKLLITENPDVMHDRNLLAKLGIEVEKIA